MKNLALMAFVALAACNDHKRVVPVHYDEPQEAQQYVASPAPQPVVQAAPQAPVVIHERSSDSSNGLLWYMMGRATAPTYHAPTQVYHAPPVYHPAPVYHAPAPVYRSTTVYRAPPAPKPTYRPAPVRAAPKAQLYRTAPRPSSSRSFTLRKR